MKKGAVTILAAALWENRAKLSGAFSNELSLFDFRTDRF